ncbi:hypothetical protein DM02DRAFT_624696 [Periconia macrospinosa]|uniref:Mid2 domain-containing protein n=1 Tax=Periconia macrospinosa TaxID=97972 RepID=A0A2V1E352_9PLEO|nr:hypothetical protein DM02DRAFT_624696 [Periconia macrospinosa]
MTMRSLSSLPISLLLLVYIQCAIAQDRKCYGVNGVELDSSFAPCNSNPSIHSGCCATKRTSGSSDMCLDNGLCMATNKELMGTIWQMACTDPTGKDPACPKVCPGAMSDGTKALAWNIQMCDYGSYCCREAGDLSNCCTDPNIPRISSRSIGSLLSPILSALSPPIPPPPPSSSSSSSTSSTPLPSSSSSSSSSSSPTPSPLPSPSPSDPPLPSSSSSSSSSPTPSPSSSNPPLPSSSSPTPEATALTPTSIQPNPEALLAPTSTPSPTFSPHDLSTLCAAEKQKTANMVGGAVGGITGALLIGLVALVVWMHRKEKRQRLLKEHYEEQFRNSYNHRPWRGAGDAGVVIINNEVDVHDEDDEEFERWKEGGEDGGR